MGEKELGDSISNFNIICSYNASAEQKIRNGDFQGAIEYYTKIIKLLPIDAKAYYNRSQVYAILNDEINQVKDLEEALKLEPENTEFLKYQTDLEELDNSLERSSRKLMAAIKKKKRKTNS